MASASMIERIVTPYAHHAARSDIGERRAAALRGRRLVLLAACCIVTPALADGMGRGLGAMRGAIIGDIIGGGGGAAVGAAVGAMIGAEGTVSAEQEYLDQKQAEADARLAQWEAEQSLREIEAREERERTEHLAALGSGVDLDLLLDIQRELIDRGYDPGPIGIQSPELTTAIVRYQESAGLLPDGSMSNDLLAQMRGEAG